MCRLSGPGRLAPIGWWFHHTHNDHSDRFQSDTIQHRCTVAVTVQVDGSTGSCQASVSLCMYSLGVLHWCTRRHWPSTARPHLDEEFPE